MRTKKQIQASSSRWTKLREDYECKGRIRADSKARPTFCYRVRGEQTDRGKVHVVQLISRRTGKPVGFISTDYRLSPERTKAHEWDYLNKHAAEWFIRDSIQSSASKHPLDANSRALVKEIEKASTRG